MHADGNPRLILPDGFAIDFRTRTHTHTPLNTRSEEGLPRYTSASHIKRPVSHAYAHVTYIPHTHTHTMGVEDL